MIPPDQQARQQALDTSRAFIVQAPAGSGKTELLVQRYLALLSQVERAPEEILAITFTRKAAAEMRQRILAALRAAQNPMPEQAHAQQTWRLAHAALMRDQQAKWHLLENPNRLRVQTIDALCASFSRQAPLLSGLGIAHDVLDQQETHLYYLNAIRRLMTHLEENSPVAGSLEQLLLHLDNRVDLLENLLLRMLARRDQWLPHVMAHNKRLNANQFRQLLENGLYHIVAELLQHCAQTIPPMLHEELLCLFRHAVSHYPEFAISAEQLNLFPTPSPENLPIWRALSQLLLTKEQTWRLTVTKNCGFPAEYKAIKQRMLVLLNQLRPLESLRESLAAITTAPPIDYTESQWRIINALTEILPLLVAELNVLFREQNATDFSEIAMAASNALGDKDSPTDLTLLLEQQIRHILVDEFQDTAMTQFRLLEKLTAQWQLNDGRTLFLVGDPMQSIYRFREAEVGLFLKAQQEGLGSVALTPLTLQANFRSTPTITDWINTHFTDLFPKDGDISAGAIPFSPCIATKTPTAASGVFLHPFLQDTTSSVEKIIAIIRDEQARDPEHDIAVLVRSRTHLADIIPALNKAGLSFNAVEIHPLAAQPCVQDLLALTGALLHLGDRLCWLSVLRAPWCGLTLADLHVLANEHPKKPLWNTLLAYSQLPSLSVDAQTRLAAIMPVFIHSMAERGRQSLRALVEKTWAALNGPACVVNGGELSHADAYFKVLDGFDKTGKIPDYAELVEKVENEYATPPVVNDCRLHVMTIHKAKGLEFDTVIIPQLHAKSRPDDEQLLLWLDRPRAGANNNLILAPIKSKSSDHDAIYAYLQRIEKTKSQYELTRLLYVAATRAKKNLHLLADVVYENNPSKVTTHADVPRLVRGIQIRQAPKLDPADKPRDVEASGKQLQLKKPAPNSFLHLLWSPFQQTALEKFSMLHAETPAATMLPTNKPLLRRLRLLSPKPEIEKNMLNPATENAAHLQTETTAEILGIVIHRLLQQLSQEDLSTWHADKIQQQHVYWRKLLLERKLTSDALEDSLSKINTAITRTLNDPRGRWILSAHTAQQSEYKLTTIVHDVLKQVVIDRTFVDENDTRWIIDYKISAPISEHESDFLDQAKIRHGAQLHKYAHIMRQMDARPIRLGLYFPLFGGWREWGYQEKLPS